MGQTQECYVCRSVGLLVEDRIHVTPAAGQEGPLFVGQCPRCNRFICAEHGEPLDLTGRRRWPWRKPDSLTVCCPFDPGVPLGRPE